MEQIICVAHRPLTDCRFDKSIIKPFGNVFRPNTMYSALHCVHKFFFNLSAEKTVNVLNALPRVRRQIFFLKNKQIRFSWSMTIGFLFSKSYKKNSRYYWRCLCSWKVLFKTEVCLCPDMEREEWKRLRMSAMQSVLPHFEDSFKGPKAYKYVVWRWWHTLRCENDESWLRKRKTVSFFGKLFPPITISYAQTCAKKAINLPFMA